MSTASADHDRVLTAVVSALSQVLSCPVTLTTDVPAALATFQHDHCLSSQLQPAFTASALREFVRDMPTQVVHEVEEPLGMAVTLTRWDAYLLVIGPYTHEPLYPGAAEEVLRTLGIPSSQLSQYKLYRTRYPILDPEHVHRSAAALLTAAGTEDAMGTLLHIKAEGGSIVPGFGELPQSASTTVIEERYRLEADFMDAVADGSTEQALTALQRLAGMPQTISYLNTPFLGTTILRIMARVAAQRGGLPAVTIDAISQQYAQRLHRVGHTVDPQRTIGFTGQMVTDFCQNVRRHQQRSLPPLVRRVTDEIDLHLTRDVSTAELAERLGVSTSTIARRFKEATGTTVAGYVAHRRAERAARLLATTSQSVKDIAVFVGYDDANYFVKVFRGEYGVTPTAYRDAHTR
ncbi:helix-turn-helix transcriptional regulator [Microbacterium jejuense]|uniref:Helix-turn-helix transcriptional regulator n=1 Tax=Microbacterium jejuense TaxID=1263637 RepID=A0ABS7HPT1_9MICO|nr:AraC family transcriptional regulator [Microbacterium jejuense]MBW9094966.1 helix-turn-helix transcriptional regulator [Microbacterium jejuense]